MPAPPVCLSLNPLQQGGDCSTLGSATMRTEGRPIWDISEVIMTVYSEVSRKESEVGEPVRKGWGWESLTSSRSL